MSDVKTRWVVEFIDGDGSDEWQLMRNDHRQYFTSEAEAKPFMETKKFKGKQSWWQPHMWKEEEHVFSYPKWVKI